jgi:arylsulfatase A-like enzyme
MVTCNAPHGPFNVHEKYSRPYEEMGIPRNRARFYGMIANIDENVGRLRQRLDELGLAD